MTQTSQQRKNLAEVRCLLYKEPNLSKNGHRKLALLLQYQVKPNGCLSVIAMAPTENNPLRRGHTPLPKRVVGTFDNTIDTAETVINGKQNDTATLQSTDTLLLKHRPTLNGTSCLPNPRCPIELQVLLGYTDSYLALSREPFCLPDLVPTHGVF